VVNVDPGVQAAQGLSIEGRPGLQAL